MTCLLIAKCRERDRTQGMLTIPQLLEHPLKNDRDLPSPASQEASSPKILKMIRGEKNELVEKERIVSNGISNQRRMIYSGGVSRSETRCLRGCQHLTPRLGTTTYLTTTRSMIMNLLLRSLNQQWTKVQLLTVDA